MSQIIDWWIRCDARFSRLSVIFLLILRHLLSLEVFKVLLKLVELLFLPLNLLLFSQNLMRRLGTRNSLRSNLSILYDFHFFVSIFHHSIKSQKLILKLNFLLFFRCWVFLGRLFLHSRNVRWGNILGITPSIQITMAIENFSHCNLRFGTNNTFLRGNSWLIQMIFTRR